MTSTPNSTSDNKATRIQILSFAKPHMRTFHLTWLAFFLAFLGWFGIAPLMAVVREDLDLTRTQIGNTIIASVAITILARVAIGWLCDRYSPRITYSGLLIFGAIPVMCIGLAQNYEQFLLFRLAIGVIGASFVITQYHTSVMFAPNVVGTAKAMTAGWGNLGGAAAQMAMPLILGLAMLWFGVDKFMGWRIAMLVPGIALILMGIAYYFLTQDTPDGNYSDLRHTGQEGHPSKGESAMWQTVKDHRVWALFLMYGACFGVELTINNVAALYYHDRFELTVGQAGLIAGLFGLMNIFARALGGMFGDRAGIRFGLKGRVMFLGIVLLAEGLALVLFSQMATLFLAITAMIVFSLFVQMSEGATFSVVPFINRRSVGSVAGIVGAGGNAGAFAFGFLFRIEGLTIGQDLLLVGIAVICASMLIFLVRFTPEEEAEDREAINNALEARDAEWG